MKKTLEKRKVENTAKSLKKAHKTARKKNADKLTVPEALLSPKTPAENLSVEDGSEGKIEPTSVADEIKECDRRYFFKQIEIAELCGVTKQYVSRKISENSVVPVAGLFDARVVLPILFKNKGDDRLLAAKIRQAEADATMSEIQLAKMRRDVITMSEVSEVVKKCFEAFSAAIQIFPRKVARRVAGLATPEEALSVITPETDRWQAQMLDAVRKQFAAESPEPDFTESSAARLPSEPSAR